MRSPFVFKKSLLAALTASGALLTACGGGSNGTIVTPDAAAPSAAASTTLTGVAATGAPFAGATVTVTPQTGSAITCATVTAADGSFSCTLPAGTVGPLVLTATLGSEVHYSVAPTAASGTVNITKLTDVIASQLAPNGDPSTLAAAVQTDASVASSDAVKTQVARLLAALQPLFAALGLSATDPISVAFTADGTGTDKLLDSLVVNVRPTGDTSNVSIAVRSTDAVPPSVTFATGSSVATAAITPLPTVSTTTLASLPGPAEVADLMTRMTACFAAPASVRVAGGDDSGSATATGGASAVISAACRTLFVNDDPASYLSNGRTVGLGVTGAGSYSILFYASATGTVFDNGVAEYQRSNDAKDIVLSYRQTDALKNVIYDSVVVRNVAGTLKLIGNQYAYVGRARPYQEYRELLNSPAYSSYNVGYNIEVDDVLSSGVSIFSKVVVTPPAGLIDGASTFTFLPLPGNSSLSLQGTANVTALRLAGAFQDQTVTASLPAKETGTYFAANPLQSDARIAALPEQGVWSFEFFFADTTKANVVQTTRTLTRPSTVAEFRKIPMMDMTAGVRADAIAQSAANGGIVFGALVASDPNIVDFSADGNLDGWTVPAGAAAPTSLGVLGSAPFGSTTAGVTGLSFNDGATFLTSTRKAKVYCGKQSTADLHCDATQTSQYAQGTKVTQFTFASLSQKQVTSSRRFALYKIQ